jgi:hypothetical protein
MGDCNVLELLLQISHPPSAMVMADSHNNRYATLNGR